MSRVRVHGFSVSIDGYGAGPRQDLDREDLAGFFDSLLFLPKPVATGS